MTNEELRIINALKQLKANPLLFMETYGKVPDKLGKLVPFVATKAQRRVYEAYIKQVRAKKPVRLCVVKCRQAKITTFVSYLGATLSMLNPNYGYRCITQREKAVSDVMKKIKLYVDYIPKSLKPEISKYNEDTIVFNTRNNNTNGLNSDIQVLVASGSGVGRGGTIQFLHSTEIDYWESEPDDVLSGIENSMLNAPGTVRIVESTANGYKYLKTMVDRSRRGESDFEIVFIPWYDIEEYTIEYAPGFEETLTEDERTMKELYNLTYGQIAWYRDKFRNECKGDHNLMSRDFPTTLEEAFIASGESVFDINSINKRIEDLQNSKVTPPTYVMVYEYDNARPMRWKLKTETQNPQIWMFQKPRPDRAYIMAVDTSGYGSDFTVAQIIDHETGDQVAMYRAKTPEDLSAQVLYCLASIYNQALVVVENNYSSYIIKELQRYLYTNIYRTQVFDTSTNRYLDRLGFNTNTSTRPLVVAELIELFRDQIELVHDFTTLNEARTFVNIPTPNGTPKPQAIKGCHDDTLMALGIAQLIRKNTVPLKPIKQSIEHSDRGSSSGFYRKLF